VAQIKVDDAYRVRSAGGGGYGPSWERPVEAVRHDVRQGYVSPEAAAEKYGVIVDPKTFDIDLGATEQRRAMMQVNEETSAE
jgi:N-methylhydantoinase B